MRWKRGSRLKLVADNDAPPRTRAIYAEVRERMGVPAVPTLYQAYGAVPEFLDLHWRAFRPLLESRQFFVLGARLAAEAYTRAHNYFEVDGLADANSALTCAALPVAQVLDYYQYLDPLLLLIATAQMQAFEGPVGQSALVPEIAGHLNFVSAPQLLADSEAKPAMARIWDERRRVLELAFIADEHRALACWPDFYRAYWATLKTLLQSPLYADCQYRIGESAFALVRELPVKVDTDAAQLLEAGVDEAQVSYVARMNQAFMQALTGLLLDVTFARIGCEGGSRNGTKIAASEGPELPSRVA